MAEHYAALDVSDLTTAICVVDRKGRTIWEGSAATEPKALIAALKPHKAVLQAVGLEAGTKAAWLYRALIAKRFPVICLETRHAHAALQAQRNKTDTHDARGLALLLSRGFTAQAYVKSDAAIQTRMLMNFRKVLQRKAVDIYITMRMSAKQFGGTVTRSGATISIDCTGPNAEFFADLSKPLIRAHAITVAEFARIDKRVAAMVKSDRVCRRLMTIPGVGPLTALTFKAAIDDPHRFKSSRSVGAHFGLTPRRFQSGQVDIMGRISKRGDRMVRQYLYDAAFSLIKTSRSRCPLRLWALALEEEKGLKIATVAVARKLAVVMHRLWITERDFDPRPQN